MLLNLFLLFIQGSFTNSRLEPCQSYLNSLSSGSWVKLICGASNHDVSLVRNLCFLYTLAGIDCIDISPDPAVVISAVEGVERALSHNEKTSRPLIMISVNDDEDPHFRKAYFDISKCPSDCSRPCQKVCPALAIPNVEIGETRGVVENKCYGCGRCRPVCPYDIIDMNNYIVNYKIINELFESKIVDSIEIHTQNYHNEKFQNLWSKIDKHVLHHSKIISVSFPHMGSDTIPYIADIQNIISSSSFWNDFTGKQIFQTDGRPMSGDIGKGTALASAEFASEFLDRLVSSQGDGNLNGINLKNGSMFVQLAGGTNDYSLTIAKEQKLFEKQGFGGFAFGGYARKKISQVLSSLEEKFHVVKIEDHPRQFEECFSFASNLVSKTKQLHRPRY
jgi:Fe-S-cluster-containing hydrogenase component 2